MNNPQTLNSNQSNDIQCVLCNVCSIRYQIVNPARQYRENCNVIGNNDMSIVPKTIPELSMERAINSALIKSSCMRVSNVTSIATALFSDS